MMTMTTTDKTTLGRENAVIQALVQSQSSVISFALVIENVSESTQIRSAFICRHFARLEVLRQHSSGQPGG